MIDLGIKIVIGLVLLSIIASFFLGIDLFEVIKEDGLKSIWDQIWYGADGPPQGLKEMQK